jgi:phospholipase C
LVTKKVTGILLMLAVIGSGDTSPETAIVLREIPSKIAAHSGFNKVKHVIIVIMENRSFDHYFGTFRGADGIPMKNGGAHGLYSRSGYPWMCETVSWIR